MSSQSLGKLVLNYTNTKTSSVYIDRIWVTVDMRLPTYRNITIGGSTNFIAADSYIPLNNINENNGTNAAKEHTTSWWHWTNRSRTCTV